MAQSVSIQRLDKRIDNLSKRVTGIKEMVVERFDSVDNRFDNMAIQLGIVEGKLDMLLAALKVSVTVNRNDGTVKSG